MLFALLRSRKVFCQSTSLCIFHTQQGQFLPVCVNSLPILHKKLISSSYLPNIKQIYSIYLYKWRKYMNRKTIFSIVIVMSVIALAACTTATPTTATSNNNGVSVTLP